MIDNISINDIFWIQFREHLLSFGFKGLPKDTHFTIVFDDKNPDINLHATKNVSNSKDKPQIKIVVIDKILLEEVIPSLTLLFLNKILQPLDMDEFKSKHKHGLKFISFDTLECLGTYSMTERVLINSFKDIAKFRQKTRLKIKGDIANRLEAIASSEDLQSLILKNMVELSNEFKKPVDGGIIISEENYLQVIRINDRWFTFRTDIKLFDILTAIVNPKLARHLIWKTKRALVAVKNADNYTDIKHLNKPVRLVKQPKIGQACGTKTNKRSV
jgi:hypothetical protein